MAAGVRGGALAEIGAAGHAHDLPLPGEERRGGEVDVNPVGDRRVVARAPEPEGAATLVLHHGEVVGGVAARGLVLLPAGRHAVSAQRGLAPVLDDRGDPLRGGRRAPTPPRARTAAAGGRARAPPGEPPAPT